MSDLRDIQHVLSVWLFMAVFVIIFSLIVHSTRAYANQKRFWIIQAIAFVLTFAISAILLVVFHVEPVLAGMCALLVGFIIQGDVALSSNKEKPGAQHIKPEIQVISDDE
jgi:hypothetical protein